LLLSEKTSWQGMKTVSEIRRINKLPIPMNPDSSYKVKKKKKKKIIREKLINK